jgi:hypothetical protein
MTGLAAFVAPESSCSSNYRKELRISEAAGLRRKDVDLAAGTIRIENNAVQVLGRVIEGPPKTRAGRRSMTLPPSVMEDLRVHLERQPGSTYVFGPSGEHPLFADEWRSRPWRRAVPADELSPLRPHDLKHSGVALPSPVSIPPRSRDAPAAVPSGSPTLWAPLPRDRQAGGAEVGASATFKSRLSMTGASATL